MSDWKEELKETIKPSVDLSKYDLQEMLKIARDHGACSEEIRRIRQFNTVEEAMQHSYAPFWCYWYAISVIKGRWEAGEPVIMWSSRYIYHYAKFVLKKRWKEGEPALEEGFGWKQEYEAHFGCKI